MKVALDWPTLNANDKLKVVKRGRFWAIRAECRRRLTHWEIKDKTLITYWPDNATVIEITGQDLLGFYTRKRTALKIVAKLEEARKA